MVTDRRSQIRQGEKDYTVTLPVDQSIQLGDGGVGFSIESQGCYQFSNRFTWYYNAFCNRSKAQMASYINNPTSTTTDLSSVQTRSRLVEYRYNFHRNRGPWHSPHRTKSYMISRIPPVYDMVMLHLLSFDSLTARIVSTENFDRPVISYFI